MLKALPRLHPYVVVFTTIPNVCSPFPKGLPKGIKGELGESQDLWFLNVGLSFLFQALPILFFSFCWALVFMVAPGAADGCTGSDSGCFAWQQNLLWSQKGLTKFIRMAWVGGDLKDHQIPPLGSFVIFVFTYAILTNTKVFLKFTWFYSLLLILMVVIWHF